MSSTSKHRVRDYTGEYVIVDAWEADAFAAESHLAPLAAHEARSRVSLWSRDPEIGKMLRRVVLDWNGQGVLNADAAERALDDAFRIRWKVFKFPRVEHKPVKITEAQGAANVLGPEPVNDDEPDVFVLAAEVKLIGDTPLINHAVRIIDPDTGAVVAEDTTDEQGIIRTEVPANKKYRIEIVDDDPAHHEWRTVRMPHPMLRCVFVDLAGAPVPHVDVQVKDLDGQVTELEADENGVVEMAAPLGLYEVTVEGESHWVHSLLHRDGANDAYEIVVASALEEGGDGIDPDDRLTRAWDHGNDIDEDDDGVVA